MRYAVSNHDLMTGLLQFFPRLPSGDELGVAFLQWPEFQEQLSLQRLTALANRLKVRLPTRKTEKGIARAIVDALHDHHITIAAPAHHPSDVCGACKQPMPWRPANKEAVHSCDRCGAPLHGAAIESCCRIITSEGKFYCNDGCYNASS